MSTDDPAPPRCSDRHGLRHGRHQGPHLVADEAADRSTHSGRRSRRACHQGRYAHHGRPGHRGRGVSGLRPERPLPGHLHAERDLRDAGHHGRWRRRPDGRLDQGRPGTEPGPEQAGQDARPAGGRRDVRRPDAGARTDPHAALLHTLRPAGPGTREHPVGGLGRTAHHRVGECGQPHRRPGRPGGRRRHVLLRGLHGGGLLAVPLPGDLRRGPRSGPGGGGRGHGGWLSGLPLVERGPGPDLHGGHRLPGNRHRPGHAGPDHQHPPAAAHRGRAVRGRDGVGHPAGRQLPAAGWSARVPDGPGAPPLRTARLA